ncbi:MAG: FkbM family methyltransferase [Blastocatellia bacterium]
MNSTTLKKLCEEASERIRENRQLFNQLPPVFVYGTGLFAQDIQEMLLDKGFSIIGFIDHRQTEKSHLNGLPVYRPEQAATLKYSERTVVVLGIHNCQANISDVNAKLKASGFHRVITPLDLYDLFGAELGIRYWLVNREYYFSRLEYLQAAFDLLSDLTSRSLFKSVTEFRLIGDASRLPEPDLVNQYHPYDLFDWRRPLRFVDCGAYNGDTLADFIGNGITIRSVAAFEPDLANYAKLATFVLENRDVLPEAVLFPCGLYSSSRQLSFQAGQGAASNISNSGTTVVQCVALDDAIPTFAPDYIKMDIEGAEYAALQGARRLISGHTPLLAISLYHRPEHLWQLPLLVESLAPARYNFHMRLHTRNDFDLVLYAIPKEIA